MRVHRCGGYAVCACRNIAKKCTTRRRARRETTLAATATASTTDDHGGGGDGGDGVGGVNDRPGMCACVHMRTFAQRVELSDLEIARAAALTAHIGHIIYGQYAREVRWSAQNFEQYITQSECNADARRRRPHNWSRM